jgi:hypothetical protein
LPPEMESECIVSESAPKRFFFRRHSLAQFSCECELLASRILVSGYFTSTPGPLPSGEGNRIRSDFSKLSLHSPLVPLA